LIADDEETFLLSTADLLRREGYHCDCAPDGKRAAEMLGKGEYDLLIADIKMPGNGNLELVREMPRLAEGLPVILVTGYPSLKTAMESFQLPVAAYLPKPVELPRPFWPGSGGHPKISVFQSSPQDPKPPAALGRGFKADGGNLSRAAASGILDHHRQLPEHDL
jgi:CheY-like chemotaxis protein